MTVQRLEETIRAPAEAIKNLKNVVVKRYKAILCHTQITFAFDNKLRY